MKLIYEKEALSIELILKGTDCTENQTQSPAVFEAGDGHSPPPAASGDGGRGKRVPYCGEHGGRTEP